jgi:hypothetical protein
MDEVKKSCNLKDERFLRWIRFPSSKGCSVRSQKSVSSSPLSQPDIKRENIRAASLKQSALAFVVKYARSIQKVPGMWL